MSYVLHDYNQITVTFDSLEDLHAQYPKLVTGYNLTHANDRIFKRKAHGEWYGGNLQTGLQAMDKVLHNWPEMHEVLLGMWGTEKPVLEQAASTVQTRRRKRKRADYGDTLDMHKVWGGQIDTAWERPEREYRQSVSQRHATIFIDTCMHYDIKASEALWRAAAATLICDLLVSAGRSVEIYVGSSSYSTYANGPKYLWASMLVKRFTDPLIPERLSAVCTPAFHRSYEWLMRMCVPYNVAANMGYPANNGLPLQLRDRQKAGELVVRIGECFSRAAAEQEFYKVAAALKREGVQHEEAI